MYVPIPPTADGVIRSTVLPGFQFRVSDLHTRPSLEALAEDGVYHDYVLPSHKEVRRRAERAEQAERRAEQEAERAEQEARLRERAERQFTETARNMLSNGLETALIMKYTGLSADELAALSGTGARV